MLLRVSKPDEITLSITPREVDVATSSAESSNANGADVEGLADVVSTMTSLMLFKPEFIASKPDWKKLRMVVVISSVVVIGGGKVVVVVVVVVVVRAKVEACVAILAVVLWIMRSKK